MYFRLLRASSSSICGAACAVSILLGTEHRKPRPFGRDFDAVLYLCRRLQSILLAKSFPYSKHPPRSNWCANGIKVEPPGSGASADQSRSSLKLNRGCKPHSPRAFLLRCVWCGLLALLPGRNLGAGCRLRRNRKRNQPTGRKLDIKFTSSSNLLNL